MEVLRRRRGNHLGLVPIRLNGGPGVVGFAGERRELQARGHSSGAENRATALIALRPRGRCVLRITER